MKKFLKKKVSIIRKYFPLFSVIIFIGFSPFPAFTQKIEKKGHFRTSFPVKEKKTSRKPYSPPPFARGPASRKMSFPQKRESRSLLQEPASRGSNRMGLILIDPFSDLPLVHNYWVEQWIQAFQSRYSSRFRLWLERSYRYIPMMKEIFKKQNLPEDLAYLAMIESGFSSGAISSAQAVGYWQFIKATASRFGLREASWLDERKDFEKSTYAASQYLRFLYKQFGDWYLAAAAYNMGEQKLTRLIKKYKTKNFWSLAQKYDFPYETGQYVPQLIAAITIAKAPPLYGFNYLKIKEPYTYEIFYLPGGTNLRLLASYIKEPYKKIKTLNPALLRDSIPRYIEHWRTRIPKGSSKKVSQYVNTYLISSLSKDH
ncbi:MAG: lytic transglycosylase domain-containing protein [Bdellovibrionales bacterium]|nr:lytic transglycosylase domain-containing protein [Bdellovibrionales bacterium]